MCRRLSLAAQVGAGIGEGLEHICACSETGLELRPFCLRTGWILHPREEKSVHDSHSSIQQQPGSLYLVLISLFRAFPYPPTNPGSFLRLLVWLCLTAPAALPGREQPGGRARGAQAGRKGVNCMAGCLHQGENENSAAISQPGVSQLPRPKCAPSHHCGGDLGGCFSPAFPAATALPW